MILSETLLARPGVRAAVFAPTMHDVLALMTDELTWCAGHGGDVKRVGQLRWEYAGGAVADYFPARDPRWLETHLRGHNFQLLVDHYCLTPELRAFLRTRLRSSNPAVPVIGLLYPEEVV